MLETFSEEMGRKATRTGCGLLAHWRAARRHRNPLEPAHLRRLKPEVWFRSANLYVRLDQFLGDEDGRPHFKKQILADGGLQCRSPVLPRGNRPALGATGSEVWPGSAGIS